MSKNRTVTGTTLWIDLMRHPQYKSRVPRGEQVRPHMKYCNDLASAKAPSPDDPVSARSLVLLDLLMADMIAEQLRQAREDEDDESEGRQLLDERLRQNAEFREKVSAALEKIEGMEEVKAQALTRKLLLKYLRIPNDIAKRCLHEQWTLGDLMLAHPPFYARNIAFSRLTAGRLHGQE